MSDVMTAVKPGAVLAGKYEVERTLGQGGMAVVVEAKHVDLDAQRAIKVPRHSTDGYDAQAERFRREARIVSALSSPHVVRVHDSGRLDDGMPYIVMERLQGMDLCELLRSRRTLSITEAAGYVAQACEAMSELHALGIVHLDLKPANLFLTRAAGVACVKVLDFGVARRLRAPGPAPAVVEGSMGYMSPEQAMAPAEVGVAADIWALGVILYELLTGQLPFYDKTLARTLVLMMAIEPVSPKLLRPGLPAALSDVILKCLQKNPARRYASAAELGAALAPFLSLEEELDGRGDESTQAAKAPRACPSATTARLAIADTLAATVPDRGRMRRSTVIALSWMARAGAFVARAPNPVDMVVAVGLGALGRYRQGRGSLPARAAA